MNPQHLFSMMGGDPNDAARLAEILKSMYVAGIDAGRAIKTAESKMESQAAYGAGFKQGHDEGRKESMEKIGRMAQELLKYRENGKTSRTKRDTQKKS